MTYFVSKLQNSTWKKIISSFLIFSFLRSENGIIITNILSLLTPHK